MREHKQSLRNTNIGTALSGGVPLRETIRTKRDIGFSAPKIMPEFPQPKKVLILGSGGLSIGQAGEFDYSGKWAHYVLFSILCQYLEHTFSPMQAPRPSRRSRIATSRVY